MGHGILPCIVQRVRLKEVAERAGVAINTASTILNRRPNSWASKATMERVFKAAADLGYRPNRAAQALRVGHGSSFALLIPDLNNPFCAAFADRFEEAASERRCDILIKTWRNQLDREKRLLEELANLQVDGVAAFLSDPEIHGARLAEQAWQGVPFVVISPRGGPPLPVDSVLADFERGLRDAFEKLTQFGHRRFAFLCALAEGQSPGANPELFHVLLAERGVSATEINIVRCKPSIVSAYAAATALLSRQAGQRPTALIALDVFSAVGAMRAAAEKGLVIPRDLSVVGVDDVPLASFLPVALSTITQPAAEMARCAVGLLGSRIEEGAMNHQPEQVVFPMSFIPRESIGPAP
jgi:LacI family transcriptional regulator